MVKAENRGDERPKNVPFSRCRPTPRTHTLHTPPHPPQYLTEAATP